MKKIQAIIFSVALLLTLHCNSYAQSSTPEARAQKWTDWMTKELQLTDDQIPKIHAVNLKYAQKAETVKTQGTSEREKFTVLKENDKAKDGELKPILSDDQFKKYQDKKREKQKEFLQQARSNK